MDNNIENIYDGMPIIPEDIKQMSQEELDNEWEKIIATHNDN